MGNILSIDGICKSFSGIQVPKNVSPELGTGQIICLVGGNGVSRSTLIRIFSGAERPGKGKVTIFGTTYGRMTPSQVMHLGIATIYQNADPVNSPTVLDSTFLENERLRGRAFVNSREQKERTRRLLRSLSMDMKPSILVEGLSPGQEQDLQIAKALHQEVRILTMDKPTASLGEEETTSLMNLVGRLGKKGLGVIYIPHYLEEMFHLGDVAYVLRDGAVAEKSILKETNQDELIKAMVERDVSNFCQKGSFSSDDRAFVAEHYSGDRIVRDVSFSVPRGEVFGLSGSVGAGRAGPVRMIYGANKEDSGILILDGKDTAPINPKSAVKEGVFLVSEDRKDEGLSLVRLARENLTISKNDNSLFLNLRKEEGTMDKSVQQLRIKVFSQEQEVGNLSSSNQRKVAISHWSLEDGDVYIFDEPTRGVDVGAKEETYKLIERLAKGQKIVTMVSSDMSELILMSDRVGIMREGRLVYILNSTHVTEDGLIKEYIEVKERRINEG